MTDSMMLTISAGAFVLVLAFDAYLSHTGHYVVSTWVRDHITVTHWIAFTFGWLMAHWFS